MQQRLDAMKVSPAAYKAMAGLQAYVDQSGLERSLLKLVETISAFRRRVDCSRPDTGLYLPAGWSLRASTHNAETFNVHAFGSDL